MGFGFNNVPYTTLWVSTGDQDGEEYVLMGFRCSELDDLCLSAIHDIWRRGKLTSLACFRHRVLCLVPRN